MAQEKAPNPLTPSKEASLETTSPERLKELANQDLQLACIVAKNISAPSDLLAELAHSQDQSIRKAVASNPNTPKETLLELGAQFPKELLDNPIFNLLLLENLNLLAEIPENTLESIVKLDNFPKSFFNWVLNNGNDNLLIALLSNPNLTLEYLNKLTSHKNPLIALEAKLHINWDGEIASVEDSIKQVLLKKSNNISISKYTNIFLNLFRKGILNKWSKEEWATPIAFCLRDSEILLYLNNQDRNIFNASDKNCADFNSQNNDVFLDKNLEDITSIRQYDEDEMSNETFDRVSDELDDLWGLAETEDDPDILHEIYHSIPSYSSKLHYTAMDIYKALIKNYYTPSSVLKDLFGNYEDLFDMDIGSEEGIVFHPNAPTNSLESLADEILEYLNDGLDEHLLLSLINNQNTPVELLEKLATDSDQEIRRNVACHSNTPVDILNEHIQSFVSFLTEDNDSSWGRFIIFFSPYAQVSSLENNCHSSFWLERYAIAQNPNTPDNALSHQGFLGLKPRASSTALYFYSTILTRVVSQHIINI